MRARAFWGVLVLMLVAMLAVTISAQSAGGGSFTDTRDGKTYRMAVMPDGKTWMAENLNYQITSGSYCYGDDPSNCDTYGRLYTWSAAMGGASSSSADPSGVQGVCPAGWHLPSDAEWSVLVNAVNTSSTSTNNAAIHLKSQTGWYNCHPSGSGSSYQCADTHGFSALPGGLRWSVGSFYNVGYGGRWWSATELGATIARRRIMYYDNDNVISDWNFKTNALSVRCVKN